jgi:hypothetical protein
MIPLKPENKQGTKAFDKILNNMDIPKTIYSDQGSEFKTKHFKNY